jgi:hypothetical protein
MLHLEGGWKPGDSSTRGKHKATLVVLLMESLSVHERFLHSSLNSLEALQNFRLLVSNVHLDGSLHINISSG